MIPTFVSYLVEKRLSAHPEEFGQGAIEGVAGPEAANNAAAAGVLVPLLTLGLPSSATAAVLLTAFQQYGIQPGPLLFTTRPDLVWTLIASLYIGNVLLLVLNLPLAPLVGTRDAHPPLAALWRHSGAGIGRRLQPEPIAARSCAALHRGRGRLRHARLRHSAGSGSHGPRPGPARRAAIPTHAGHQPGRRVGVRHATRLRVCCSRALLFCSHNRPVTSRRASAGDSRNPASGGVRSVLSFPAAGLMKKCGNGSGGHSDYVARLMLST